MSLTGTRAGSGEEFRALVVPVLEAGCSLDVVHRLEDGAFRCLLTGRARSPGEGEAQQAAHRLWRDLQDRLSQDRGLYRFCSADPARARTLGGLGWCATAQPRGLALRVRTAIGFDAPEPGDARTVFVPTPPTHHPPFLDALATLDGFGEEVELILCLQRIQLDAAQRTLVEAALGRGDVRYANGRLVLDDDLLERLRVGLERWRREASGFRVLCSVHAPGPVSNALLDAIGEQLYPGDRPLWTSPEAVPSGSPSRPGLDLRNAFPSPDALPPLLPSRAPLSSRGMPALHLRVPDGLPAEGLWLGTAGPEGRRRRVFLPEDDRKRHAFVLGATGTGKSTFLQHLVMQDVAAGAGLCLLDPHGDLHDAVLEALEGRHEDLVVIEVGDGVRAPGINLLEVDGDGRERARASSFISNEMIAIFDRLYDLRETGGPMFETYMRNTLLLLMENRIEGGTLLDVPVIFEDSDFRARLLEECTNPLVVSFWKRQAERARGEASLPNIAPYVTSKLNQFTHNALLRPIVGQARSTVDFRACIDEGKVVLVNLSKGLLGEASSRLLGMLVLGKLFVAAMDRARAPAAERRPFYVYIDEAHEFTTSTAANMMAEARKFGLHLMMATQTLAQVSEGRNQELGKALLGNAGSLLFFRLGAPDAQTMETYTAPEFKPRELEDLPNFHVAARLLVNGRPARPFVFRTPAPTSSASPESDQARRERLQEAREAHTRPVEEVEEEFLRRRENLLESGEVDGD